LSPRGRCRTFDEGADGTVISEGVVTLLLKRLADAERDGDRIYAVIKAVAGSSDGRAKGLMAPRSEGQVRALERAYAEAGLSPSSVGLIEAHGTGTVVGDATEVESLTRVFREAGAPPASCALGSVKSMIGHTKSAAGLAGLLKAILALHHRTLPPTLHVEKPNPKLRAPDSPFYLNREARPWLSNGTPRRAGVNAFGFGGTNFHAVVEEYAGRPFEAREGAGNDRWPTELFVDRPPRRSLADDLHAL
jgi:acyl transferase domain-containing protein